MIIVDYLQDSYLALSFHERLNKLNLSFILDAYNDTSNKEDFFNSYFIKLTANLT